MSLTYNNRSIPGLGPSNPSLIFRPLRPRGPRLLGVLTSVGLAGVLGLAFGFWGRVALADSAPPPPPPVAAELLDDPPQLRIVMMGPDDALPPLRPGEQMDVSGPDSPAGPTPASLLPAVSKTEAHAEGASDCRAAGSRADQIVCLDPVLAAADRRLALAFRNLTETNRADRARMRQHLRWLAAREAAATTSHNAMVELYEARIAEIGL